MHFNGFGNIAQYERFKMLNTVTEQRDGYRAHVESFSVEALRLKEESNLLHAQNASLAEQLSAMEQEQVEVRTKWSGELDQASRQFEEMREKGDTRPPSEAFKRQKPSESA